MSRETNSNLLRYGINTFWSNSISSSRMLYFKQQFESFFNIILTNSFLYPLKIQYKANYIYIYVFFYKEEKLSFIQKYLALKKYKLTRILFRKHYNLKYNKAILTKKRNTNQNLFCLIKKKILSQLMHKNIIHKNNYTTQLNYFIFENNKKFVSKINTKILFISKYSSKKRFKLKLINYILKLKWLGSYCTTVLNLYNKSGYKIILKSALERISTIKCPFYFKYLKSNVLKQKIYMVLMSFVFFKSVILNKYIANIIKKTKNKKHVKNLILFFNLIKMMYDKQIIPFSGLKFMISGRLNGKLRKGTFGFKIGSIQLMSFKVNINYSCDVVHTQYGCFSLKLWICENSFK